MKIKKLLAILSSVIIISACAVSPIYADEPITESIDNQQQEEKITDLNEISKLISDFIKEKELAAVVSIDGTITVNDVSNVVAVTVLNYWENKETIEPIIAFINENNIAKEYVKFFMFEDIDSITVVRDPVIINIRTAAAIARTLAAGAKDLIYEYPNCDYNEDGVVNIRDAAAIARDLATGKIK